MSGDWDVWAAVEARDGLVFGTAPLPEVTGGGLFWPADPAVIVIDDRLEEPERREVLAHELVHHERGSVRHAGQSGEWHVVVAREEGAVNDEVARRLVPRSQLIEHVRGQMALGEGTSPVEVAETFAVSPRLARRALALLYQETDGRL